MSNYPLFLLLAIATVFSPGPGVVFTLANTLRHGFSVAAGGMVGIALGAVVVAMLSATGIGLLLTASVMAFTILKLVGAAYLIYLGVNMWRNPAFTFVERAETNSGSDAGGRTAEDSALRCLAEGMTLQLSNPKVIVFFLSILPQFIDVGAPYGPQFALLVLTYGGLVLVIHALYALAAHSLRRWLRAPRIGRLVSRVSGSIFIMFGAGLAMTRHS